jgi:hypothetical protein
MDLNQQNLEETLRLLRKLFTARKSAGFWLVVCDCSALLAHATRLSIHPATAGSYFLLDPT